jgi:RNase P/RNase MRP subunit p30
MAKTLALSRVGAPFDGKVHEGIIYRLRSVPPAPVTYPYLVVSNNIDEARADILTISNFHQLRNRLKKKTRKGIGLEVAIAQARKMEGAGAARWLAGVEELYEFCHSSRCQFILSSGANSTNEMVSGPCLDALLKICGIEPRRHWQEMNEWLEARLSGRVMIA